MRLPKLHEENIVLDLEDLSPREVMMQMVDRLPLRGTRDSARKKIFAQLLIREEYGTTAVGDGVALPHCLSFEVSDPIVVLGISRSGISFPSLDGQPVHFIYMLILPEQQSSEKLKRKILQKIKWILQDRYLQERLKSAHSASMVCDLLQNAHLCDADMNEALLYH